MKEDPPGRGWFAEGQDGDRTLSEQMIGLDPLYEIAPRATVLDLGCAEGLIGLELVKAGASLLHGIDLVHERVRKAREAAREYPARFWAADLARFATKPITGLLPTYDIVLCLSIVHKFAEPEAFLAAAAMRCRGTLAIRLPARILSDARSGFRRIDVPALMAAQSFEQTHDTTGPRGEWVGIFDRV